MIFNLKNKSKENPNQNLINTAALLIHAAKIDQIYTEKEKDIIKRTIIDLSETEENIDTIILEAEKLENESIQILDFTKEVKNLNEEDKIKIVEALWKIIFSDNQSDTYESNLMRRLSGLLYLDNKTVGDIKERVKSSKI
jgi:uncharacterized tellurite resistance protein B-like protein|tara:strand:+ start:21159 stop:21578 length:420 start_codon:yes stop_codon:yes gene_type:complete